MTGSDTSIKEIKLPILISVYVLISRLPSPVLLPALMNTIHHVAIPLNTNIDKPILTTLVPPTRRKRALGAPPETSSFTLFWSRLSS